MFNREDDPVREQEPLDGTMAGVPVEEHDEPVEDSARETRLPEPEQEEQTMPNAGEAQVRYVGAGGSYTDKDGTRYKKNQDVIVDEETANRLESVRGGTLFVRTA